MQFGAINTGRYKAGAVPQSTNMYSWPMNNYWVTNFNADQMGEMQWSYFINSSKDNSIEYATKFALGKPDSVLDPCFACRRLKRWSLSNRLPVFKIVPENLLLVNMRPVEGENAVMLQLREIGGKPATFSVTSDKINFVKTTVCDVVGDPVSGKSVEFRSVGE